MQIVVNLLPCGNFIPWPLRPKRKERKSFPLLWRRSEQVGATKAQKSEIMKRKAKNKLKTVLDHLSRNKLKYGIGAGALGLAGLGGIGYKMYKNRNK